MSKKILLTALAGIAAVSLSSTVLAQNFTTSNPDVYVGLQGGYGDTHWNDANFKVEDAALDDDWNLHLFDSQISRKGTGFAGRIFAGFDYNQYLALETGFTYFPRSDLKVTTQESIFDFETGKETDLLPVSQTKRFNTYGLDLLAKISVPVYDNFGLYAKAGPGYLVSGSTDTIESGIDGFKQQSNHNIDLVYGFGADYQITPHLVADASFTRFNGHHDINSKDYQPDADLYALGLAYKFNV